MSNTLNSIILVVMFVVLAGMIYVTRPAEELATGGPDSYVRQSFFNAFSTGGVVSIATTSATYTLTDAQMDEVSVISITAMATSAALALTTPASTTWPSLPSNGATQRWIIDNLHSAAATTTTITAGTGVDIDGTTANDDVLNGGVSGTLTCWRLPNSDIRCIVEEMVDAG